MFKPPLPDDPDRYLRWRRQVPFTNAQIADAMDEEAETLIGTDHAFWSQRIQRRAQMIREGARIGAKDLRHILPRLIKWCSLCGKTALYRYGSEGRCRAHKFAAPGFVRERRQRMAHAAAVFEDNLREERKQDAFNRYRAHLVKRPRMKR